jgi:hypothetical protein
MSVISLWIYICCAALFWLCWILRRARVSLGLPIAYLLSLLLIHVPGAFAHAVSDGMLYNRASRAIEIGIRFTAIGSVCFVAGVWIARYLNERAPTYHYRSVSHYEFWWFCVIGGWLFTYGLGFLHEISSIGAVVDKGGAIWMLGVLLGLRSAFERSDVKEVFIWLGVLMVYPSLMLLFGGFLSYGSTAIIIACSALIVSIRSRWRVLLGASLAIFLGLTIFVNYFAHRDNIRRVVWSGAALQERLDVVADAFSNFEWLDLGNREHLIAFDKRLNQNYFVGLAATRIQQGQVDYLYGRSVWEALISLIPRILWPEKPVFGGSPAIVSEMTGLYLSPTTSFGVGNVMEFQINFGVPGLVLGFFGLGWLLGMLDYKAAAAESCSDLERLPLFFLVGAALIQPNGSLVEMFSGAAAALVAAYGWSWAWRRWAGRGAHAHRGASSTDVGASL